METMVNTVEKKGIRLWTEVWKSESYVKKSRSV